MELLHHDLTERIVGIYYEVYRELGSGFLEKICQSAMVIALRDAGLKVEEGMQYPVFFRGHLLGEFLPRRDCRWQGPARDQIQERAPRARPGTSDQLSARVALGGRADHELRPKARVPPPRADERPQAGLASASGRGRRVRESTVRKNALVVLQVCAVRAVRRLRGSNFRAVVHSRREPFRAVRVVRALRG